MNIAEEIFKRTQPQSLAVISRDRVISYRDLNKKSAEIAEMLRREMKGPGIKRIGLLGPDSPDYISIALGILRAEGCLVPLAPTLSTRERSELTAETALDAVIVTDRNGGFLIERSPPATPPIWLEPLNAMEPAFIRFSSGTTGEAKGIVLSHRTLVERVKAANTNLGITSTDRILWVLPMSHHFAASIMLYLWHGAAIILPDSHLAEDMLGAAVKAGASIVYAAPFHFELLANCRDPTWPSLRLAVSTTAALSVETGKKFAAIYGIHPAQALGIIEVGIPCLNTADPAGCPESVGRPQPPFKIEVRVSNARLAQPADQGELYVRGPGMLDAYISPWQVQSQVLDADGWFATGDIATIDHNGFVTLRGRLRSMINVGGMKFFPEEVESILTSHPAISGARLIGRAHPDFGMVPVAEVTVAHGSTAPRVSELLALCRRELSRYKTPAEISIVDKIPLTPTGKVRRT